MIGPAVNFIQHLWLGEFRGSNLIHNALHTSQEYFLVYQSKLEWASFFAEDVRSYQHVVCDYVLETTKRRKFGGFVGRHILHWRLG